MTEALLSLPINANGRDFYLGDIHGCWDAFDELLKQVGFDPARDRVISVGDLVDRGTRCDDVLDYLKQPWFYAVRGNHEQMAIDHVTGFFDAEMYKRNGGKWFMELPFERRKELADAFADLPYLIEVEGPNDQLIGVVHGDTVTNDWDVLKANIDREDVQMLCMWARTRVERQDKTQVANVSAVILGHIICNTPQVYGNCFYIDTGCFRSGVMTMVEFVDGVGHMHQVKQERRAA
jgi:serine/threonine protein phosphatase 1